MNTKCALCGRELKLTAHHLFPKAVKTRNKYKEVEGKDETIDICQPCHSKVHSCCTEKELFELYNSVDKLMAHPEIEKFVKWIRNKDIEYMPSKEKK